MKHIYALLFIWLVGTNAGFAQSEKDMYNQMVRVNKEWAKQKDINPASFEQTTNQNEQELIQQHLIYVEQTLRNRTTDHLSQSQQENRADALDHLNDYWKEAAFPINDQQNYRTPIFIDQYNNFCAVGYLIKATGNEDISRMIAEEGNLDYVEDMHYGALISWANEYGFTKDELAWIQPSYPSTNVFVSMDGGMDGHINDIILGDDQVVYAAGSFSEAGGYTTANVAAWISGFAGYDWIGLGDGLPAEIHSLVYHEGNLYAAGEFFSFETGDGAMGSAVAKWDGNTWTPVGNLYGTVYDLVEYNGQLFAGGKQLSEDLDFSINLMKYTENGWSPTDLMIDPNGTVNTLEVINETLYIGGDFSLPVNSIRRNIVAYDESDEQETGNTTLLPDSPMEVKDIILFNEDIYICGDLFINPMEQPFMDETGTYQGLLKLNEEDILWQSMTVEGNFENEDGASINCMTIHNGKLMLGGNFRSGVVGVGTFGYHLCTFIENEDYNIFEGAGLFDNEVRASLVTDEGFYVGGLFQTNGETTVLNYIASFESVTPPGIGIDEQDGILVEMYPNPASDQLRITTENKKINSLKIINSEGKLVYYKNLPSKTEIINCSTFSKGLYLLQLTDRHNQSYSRKLMIQ